MSIPGKLTMLGLTTGGYLAGSLWGKKKQNEAARQQGFNRGMLLGSGETMRRLGVPDDERAQALRMMADEMMGKVAFKGPGLSQVRNGFFRLNKQPFFGRKVPKPPKPPKPPKLPEMPKVAIMDDIDRVTDFMHDVSTELRRKSRRGGGPIGAVGVVAMKRREDVKEIVNRAKKKANDVYTTW